MSEFSDAVRDFKANWRDSDLPTGKRTLKTIKNLSMRLRGKDCCGHLGEPGC